jgi:hypothetical protein
VQGVQHVAGWQQTGATGWQHAAAGWHVAQCCSHQWQQPADRVSAAHAAHLKNTLPDMALASSLAP